MDCLLEAINPGVYILQIIFSSGWGRVSSHNIPVASERGRGEEKWGEGRKKEGEGKKKGERRRKKRKRGRKKGRGEEKDAQGREENILKGPGEGFNNVFALKTFPSTLK